MYSLCIHYVYTMYTLCIHYVYTMYTLCIHYVYINILSQVRTKHHIKEDEALEVTIDNTRAARKVYRDLLKITGIRDLPQIFVNETFIGSWQDLKTLNKTGNGLKLSPHSVD